MKKKILFTILGVYLLFIISMPLIYFFFYGPTQEYRCSLAFDTKKNDFFIIGDSFALEKVILNDQEIEWKTKENVYRSKNISFANNKPYQILIKDKQDNFIEINFSFPLASILDKQIFDFSCKSSVVSPRITINKENFNFYKGAIDTEYIFSEKNGDIIKVKNIVLDFQYQTESAKISYGKFFVGLFTEIVRYSKIAWHFFVEFNKFVFKVTVTFLKFSKETSKPLVKYSIQGANVFADVLYREDKSLLNASKFVYKFSGNRILVMIEHVSKIFKNNYIFVFVNDFGNNSENLVESMQSNSLDVVRGVNNFFQRTVVSERVEKQKRKEIIVQNKLSSKIYKVASSLDGVEFIFSNGLGEPLVKERVKVSFSSKGKNNAMLLSPMTDFTDKNGAIKLSLRFGHKVSNHKLFITIKGKRFVYDFITEPDIPFILKDLTNRPMIFEKAGKLIKNAFVVNVYDQYNNLVPEAKVQLLEQDIDGVNEPFIFAESKSDKTGKVKFNYRMNDNSGRVLIIAKLPDAAGRFAYTVQSDSTKPVEITALGEEEVESIIGIPLKSPFKVKVIDDNGNPCPHIPIDFSFQTSTFEELEAKTVRTDKNGIAEVVFRTPEVVGYFQVVASSPKVPEFEVAFVVSVMPGNVAKMIIITGDKQTVEWEQNSEPLVVQILDDKRNPIPNAEVSWQTQKNISFVEIDETTDIDGYARAVVKVGETQSKENNLVVQVGKVKEVFKVFPKQPSYYKLDLLSKAVVNVFTSQMMAEPIEFVLRDQYGNILPEEKVSIEYIVYKRGVQYLQNYNLITNKEGIITFNFVASDQKDVINLKGKYSVDSKPRITWVKINVIPEEISNISVPSYIEGVVGSKLNKPIQVYVADNNASPVIDIFLSVRLKKYPSGANIGKEIDQTYQLKTDRQGMAEFNPVLGNLKGEYVYTAKINTLEKDIVINAIPARPERIRIVAKDKPRFPVFKQVNSLSAQVYDKYDNLITKGMLVYDINTAKKVLRHDFNKKVEINESGLTELPFQVPEKKGNYYVYITDEGYINSTFYQFDAYESGVESLILLGVEDKDNDYRAGRQYKGIFKARVVDRFGNFVAKSKLSLDLYEQGNTTSSVGADAFTDEKGVAGFDIIMPEKAGNYDLVIYSDEDNSIRQTVKIKVKPEDVYAAIILSGNNQVVNPGLPFLEDLSIKLNDRYDNPIVGEQIRWSYAIDIRGETRQYIQTLKTNEAGISTFNFITDSNPGVREIKAYYKKDRKWEYVSYYLKISGLSVDSIKKIAGETQNVLLGKEIPEFYVVKALDLKGNPVQDMPMVFQMISDDKEKNNVVILEKIGRTDSNGLVKQKFSAPVTTGKYRIVVFPQFQDKLRVTYELDVISDKIKPKAIDKGKSQVLLRILPLQSEKIVVKVGDNSRLCEVMIVDRLNNPIPGAVVEWEIYEVAKNATFTRTTRADSEGKTSLPEVNRTYERKFVIKVLEPNSRSTVIFNLDIVKDISKEVSLNFIGLPLNNTSKTLTNEIKSEVDDFSSDALNVMAEEMVVVNEAKVEVKRSNQLELYVGQAPYVLKIYNNRDRVIIGDIRVGKKRVKNNFLIEAKNVVEIAITSDVTKNIEEVKVSVAKNRMIPWIKDVGSFNLVTKAGASYSINNFDRQYRSLFVGQLDFFTFVINPMVNMIEKREIVDLEISVIPKVGQKVSFKREAIIGSEFVFEHLFEAPGEYKVVVSSYLLAKTLEYTVKVFDGDNLLKPLSGFGEYTFDQEGIIVPLSFEVIYKRTRDKVVNDFIIWEIMEKPIGAVVDFQRRSTTNEKGVAENKVSCSPVKGKYVVRARRLFAPEEYFDFVFEVK